MIYKFKGADERYLTRADEKYAVNDYEWKFMNMHETFRITKNMAKFVNRAMLGEDRLVSNKSGHDVIYDCTNAFARGTLTKHIRGFADNEIMLLAPSIKSKRAPIREFANFLSNGGHKVYAPVSDDSTPDQRDMRGKIAVLTYHQAKGLERRVVMVFNFDVSYFSFFERHADPTTCPNTLYVACTRAKEKLIVIHHNKARKGSIPFGPLPFVNTDAVKRLCEVRGKLIETWDVIRDMPSNYSVTQLCSHLNFEQIRDTHNFYATNVLEEPKGTINTKDVVHTYFGPNGDRSKDRIETVSEITGVAVPMMFAFYMHGSITNILKGTSCERIIRNIYLSTEYKEAMKNGDNRYRKEIHLEYILAHVPDFLMQANLYIADISGYVHKINQINNYTWMSPEQARAAIMRMGEYISSSAIFENRYRHTGTCILESPNGRKHSITYNVSGITDCEDVISPANNILWEFKFTDTLQAEHEIQTALYALLTECQFKSYKLFNVKTGEIRELVEPNKEVLNDLADMLLQIKISDTPAVSEVEFFRNAQLPERPPAVEGEEFSNTFENSYSNGVPRQEDIDDLCDL